MIEIGRLCVKLAGRDAGKECLIIDILDKSFVMIDGNTRRKKCNIAHLEVLPHKADIKKGASHEEVAKALESLGVKMIPKAPAREKKKPEEKKEEAPKKKSLIKLPKKKKAQPKEAVKKE